MLTGGIYERTTGAAGQPLGRGYQRRVPERTVLHELVSRHAQTLLAELRDADGCGLPRHVERELAEYLRCGILAHGFARVRCQAVSQDLAAGTKLEELIGKIKGPGTADGAPATPSAALPPLLPLPPVSTRHLETAIFSC